MAENMVVSLATFIWRESLAAFPRRIEGKHRHGAMAAVTSDRPLSEYDIRAVRRETVSESLIMRLIDDGATII